MFTALAIVGAVTVVHGIHSYFQNQRIVVIEEKHAALSADHEELKSSVPKVEYSTGAVSVEAK